MSAPSPNACTTCHQTTRPPYCIGCPRCVACQAQVYVDSNWDDTRGLAFYTSSANNGKLYLAVGNPKRLVSWLRSIAGAASIRLVFAFSVTSQINQDTYIQLHRSVRAYFMSVTDEEHIADAADLGIYTTKDWNGFPINFAAGMSRYGFDIQPRYDVQDRPPAILPPLEVPRSVLDSPNPFVRPSLPASSIK